MNAETELLLGALRRAVAGKEETLCLDVDWDLLLKTAGSHMLLPLLYHGLHSDPADWARVPEETGRIMQGMFLQAVNRDSRMDWTRQQLERKLSEAGVPFIFLKGAVLKRDYPVPALRTMCDMDVLVRTKDFPAIAAVSRSLGGRLYHSDGNHRNYVFPGGVKVEFHPNLLHQDSPVGAGINPGWQFVSPEDPHRLTEEGFYLHTICHMASHFATGGMGIRFVLDVWVCRHLRGTQPDRDAVERELKRAGLLDFAEKIEALAEWWFGSGVPTPLLEELGEYILTSGSHGQADRSMLNAVSLSVRGTGSSALLGRIFYSRAEMEARFPWCAGRPWLLPAAWCVRACRAVTRHGRLILRWGRGTASVSREEAARQREKLARFGIKRNKNGNQEAGT